MPTDRRTQAEKAYDAYVTHQAEAWWDDEYTWDEKLDDSEEDQFTPKSEDREQEASHAD